MNLETVFSQNKECPVRSIGHGLVIMDPKGDTTHSLEDIGVFIWNQLDGRHDLNNVLDAIVKKYDVEEEQARDDLLDFVSHMESTHLILKT